MIGGRELTNPTDTIGRLDENGRWSKAGHLNQARYRHNSIFNGEYIVVVGGSGWLMTEMCKINEIQTNDSVKCVQTNIGLKNYTNYPELFLVPADFCVT